MTETSSEPVPKLRSLKGVHRIYFLISSSLAMSAAIFNNFYCNLGGWTFSTNGYLYFLLGLYLPLVFLIFPAVKTRKAVSSIPWYDYLIGASVLVSCMYCFLNAMNMLLMGWEVTAPWEGKIAAVFISIGVLEGARRVSGKTFFLVTLFFGAYPLFANIMPFFLHGKSYPFWRTVSFHVMGPESIIGIPMRTTGSLLIGFMIFAVALMHTGAGNFFLDLAQALLGTVRGGAAKVSIFSSALMGSISGSVMSNVLSTGSFTIPAMKRSGYPAYYAAAVEACASSGGTMMPPIMGATAFVMAEMLQTPYTTIIKTAVIPSILYFSCLFFQADAYAALNDIKGAPRSECPDLLEVMKKSWFYLVAIAVLIYMVVFMSRETHAAWISTLLLLIISSFRKETRLNWKKFLNFIEGTGQFMTEITAVLAACGLVVGSMVFTGVANSFATEVVYIAGNNIFFLLILGALACFVLGMGMTITACYIFLALVLAPALVTIGLNPLAVHMFILYWGMASYITPPVAMGAFAAATVANADPLKTGMQSMRLGLAKYFLPFFFVLNPSLIATGSWMEIAHSFSTCLLGIALIGGAMEGYLFIVGKLSYWSRVFLFIGGVLLGYPSTATDIYGLMITIVCITALMALKGRVKQELQG